MSNGFVQRIEISREPSVILLLYLLLLYFLVAVAALLSGFSLLVKLLCGILICLFAKIDWETTQRPINIAFFQPDRWRIQMPNDQWQRVELKAYFATWSWLTLLRFELPNRRKINVMLFAGNCAPAARRRLVVWLRWGVSVDSLRG